VARVIYPIRAIGWLMQVVFFLPSAGRAQRPDLPKRLRLWGILPAMRNTAEKTLTRTNAHYRPHHNHRPENWDT
jgi:hypothetical protein